MPITAQTKSETPGWLAVVAEQVRQLRFGAVQFVVHDSRVVPIERTEKVRLPNPERSHPGNRPSPNRSDP